MSSEVESPERSTPRLVVGVGASAGGLEAFKELLAALPDAGGMAFLLVQHLDPAHESLLAELLAPKTGLTVVEADQGCELRADHVYIIRPDTALAVRDGKIEVSAPEPRRGVRLPVDHLFRSLAEAYGARATAVVLSGAGSDGSAGLREIKVAGGLTVAQDPGTCTQAGMPRSAIELGAVDFVVTIAEMPALLERFANLPAEATFDPGSGDGRSSRQESLSAGELNRLAAMLDAQLDFDLQVYKTGTIERRVLRRMVLAGLGSVDAYLERLGADASELQALARDLLINVTSFFRDPEVFRALRAKVIDPLVSAAEPGSTLRAWVPGCATGEEAYSIAIELLEAVESMDKRVELQVFATDVDQDALAVGRAGLYPPSAAEQVSGPRLARFFQPLEGKGLQVRSRLRDLVSFAAHDLTRSPPFSRMHLVSCRNVLIYLRPESQKSVLQTLHFALRRGGHLLLGTSESCAAARDLFATVSDKHGIFAKLGSSRLGFTLRDGHTQRLDPGRSRRIGAAAPVEHAEPDEQDVNEELRSANEELEATTEELRALNEELTTVNAQLRDKVVQVEQAHDDLDNFFASTDVATVFLDHRLCIERFSPAATDLLGIHHGDVGRPARDIARELLHHDLDGDAEAVLADRVPRPRELATGDGRWFSRRLRPYRTEEREIEGVVVTFFDITDLKTTSERLEQRERQQSMVARIGLLALEESDLQSFMDRVVRDVQQTLDVDLCKLLELQPGHTKLLLRAGVGWKPGLVGSAHVEGGEGSQAGYAVQALESVIVDDLAAERRFSGSPLLLDHGVVSGVSCVIRGGDQPYGVLGAHSRHQRRFGREDTDFLQAVATIVGSAIARHVSRSCLAVELAVARVLADTADLQTALGELLACMAAELGATVGEVWWPEDGRLLRRRLLYADPPSRRGRVEQELSRDTFALDEGLVGEAFQSGRAVWCSDLGDPALFVRRDCARKLGLIAGFGVPVRAAGVVIGVVTLFSHQRPFVDEVLLRSLEAIGRSIGEFARRAEAEARSQASETRKAAILDASPDGIITIDGDGRVVEFNTAAERMFGRRESEVLGTEMAALMVPERHREGHRRSLARVSAGGPSRILGQMVEMPALRADGSEFPVELVITTIDDGDRQMYTGFVRDITERKEAEEALREADRQKDEFLAMLGHELRNPLAAIRSATELLRLSARGDPEVERTREILERQGTHMSKLLDGLLDVSRIISGRIELEKERVDLARICREVWSDLQTRRQPRAPALRERLPERPVWVDGDRLRLSQVIDNLLTNAVKYTDETGSVTLELARDDGHAALAVRDTGVGIEPELMPHIFEVFRQAEQNLDRSHGGLGLGLALVRSLVELHGGTVEARSEGRGRGAEFTVRIPLAAGAPASVPEEAAEEPAGAARILLIEDHADSAVALSCLLEMYGHDVTTAARGRDGIDKARELMPDIVLCDIGLPDELSGYDVARALRGDAETNAIRLIALTGYGRDEDREKCLAAGFDAHLTKPVDPAVLKRLLQDPAADA